MRNSGAKLAVSLLIGGLVLAIAAPAGAWVPSADFITGGGWFIIDNPYATPGPTNPCEPATGCFGTNGARANFGWHGGVKNGAYWGNGNYIEHSSLGVHVHSLQVLDYVCVVNCDVTTHKDTGTRDICGEASVTSILGPYNVYYRVRMRDSGEPGAGNAGGNDAFGITLYDESNHQPVYFAQGVPISGGNIQLNKGNPSNTSPTPSHFCDSLAILYTWQ